MKTPISVIIPTFNEEKNIETALKSVTWADEIILIDSFSTDGTLEIARKYPVKILQHEYINSANQKNRAIPQATHKWVFLLDADEIATPELKLEVQETVEGKPAHDAYWIRRENYFMEKKLKHVLGRDKVIRLFRKDSCRYEDRHVHAEIQTNGSVGWLKAPIIHNTYNNGLQRYLEKIDRYTTWGARDRLSKVHTITMYHLLIKPAFRFFKHYFLSLGFLDGKVGFIVSVFGAYTVFLRSLKIWRLQREEGMDA